MRERAHVREVGPRDGIQMAKRFLPTELKLEWCRRAAAAGIGEVEVTSFVPAKVVPQFADADDVARGTVAMGGFVASALVPNLRGAERALELGVPRVNYVLSASEAHNLANVRRSTDESVADFARIVAARGAHQGPRAEIGAGIATAFGCTIQGEVPEARVVELAAILAEAGADAIIVADTVGYGDPGQVKRIVGAVMRAVAPLPVACHFHDTRGLAVANVCAAMQLGITRFDASIGGIGGCPHAPGASGNVATEDLAYLMASMGVETGLDIGRLLALRERVAGWLAGETLHGTLWRAGLPKTLQPQPEEALS